MNYSIGQVSRMFDLPISTLRYYDRQGLFRTLERSSGVRVFKNNEIEALRVIECLKRSGMEIKEIQKFMDLCEQGSQTFAQRLKLFETRLEKVNQEIEALERTKAMIQFKCWYYQTALELQDEEQVQAMIPDQLPAEIYAAWTFSHEPELSAQKQSSGEETPCGD